jgi:hypothetical protein
MASDMCLSIPNVLTFYLLGIGFGYVAPVSSEGHEDSKVETELIKKCLVLTG